MSTELTPEQEKQIRNQIMQAESNATVRVLKIMKEHFGEEAYRVYAEAQGEDIRLTWRKIAEEFGDNSLEAFIKYLWEPLKEQGYEYTMKETESGFQFYCTKCPSYENTKRSKNIDLLTRFYLACERDLYMAEGWNPNIGLKRTKTLMQGDDCCDHFYYYKDMNK
jgi:predicted ArsR family transcriptional regulator